VKETLIKEKEELKVALIQEKDMEIVQTTEQKIAEIQ